MSYLVSRQGALSAIENGRLGLRAAGIEADVVAESISLPADTDYALGFALREAITNVIRHSDATRCRVRLRQKGANVVLLVEDDGCGGVDVSGFGVRSMRERIEALGGRFDLDKNRGVKIRLTVPVADDAASSSMIPATVA